MRHSNILTGTGKALLYNRFLARAIDTLITVAVYFLGNALLPPLGVLGAAAFCAVQDGLGSGQSVGKRIAGLKVVDDETGLGVGFSHSMVRNFPFALGVLAAATPFLWVIFLLLVLPLLALELYLLFALPSGVRLGDVMGNTLVVEQLGSELPNLE